MASRKKHLKRWHGVVQTRKDIADYPFIQNPYYIVHFCKYQERGLKIYMECPEECSLGGGYDQFKASINGEWLDLRNAYAYGNAFFESGPQTAIDMIKREHRREIKNLSQRVAFGYMIEGNIREYLYAANIVADKDHLKGKLSAYKDVKRYFQKNGWCHVYGTKVVIEENFEMVTGELGEKVDSSRPVFVMLIPYSYLYKKHWRH